MGRARERGAEWGENKKKERVTDEERKDGKICALKENADNDSRLMSMTEDAG